MNPLANQSSVDVRKMIKVLRTGTRDMVEPMGFFLAQKYNHDPFVILISCLLSLRARDTVTLPIALELFSIARTPRELLQIPEKQLQKLLYPIGFYRQKTRLLRSVSKELIERFAGSVPSNEHDLLSLKGVGPKTANLVLGLAFQIPALCVDTHVHRLSNQLGLVTTKTPEQTERELKKIVPKKATKRKKAAPKRKVAKRKKRAVKKVTSRRKPAKRAKARRAPAKKAKKAAAKKTVPMKRVKVTPLPLIP